MNPWSPRCFGCFFLVSIAFLCAFASSNLALASEPISPNASWLTANDFLQVKSDINDPLEILSDQELDWQPLESFSFSAQQQQWLKLSLAPQQEPHVYFIAGSPHLRQLQLFVIQDEQTVSSQSLGSGINFSQRQMSHHLPIQALRLEQKTDLLLLITPEQQVRLNPKLMAEQDYQQFVRQQDITNSLSYGYMLALIILALVLVLITPNALHMSFLGLVFSSLLSFVVLDGMAYQFLWPHSRPWPEQLMHQVILLQLILATLYCYFALKQENNQQQSFHILGWFALAVLLTSPHLSLPWLMVISISYAIVLLTWANLLSLLLFIRARENLLITLGYFAIWPGVLIYCADVLGWINLQEQGLQYFKWCLTAGLSLQAIGMAWRVRNAALNEQKQGLKNKLRSQFFAQVSHEIRNPIQGIMGLIDILKSQANPEQKPVIQSLTEASERLSQLVNDVLDQEKLNYGQVELRPKPTNFRELIHRIHGLCDAYRQEGVEAKLIIDPRVADWLLLDNQRLGQVLNNLLSNAYKFTTKGKVELQIELVNEQKNVQWLRFSVKDQGPGLAIDELQGLFKPFSQTELGKEQQASSGLGLYISQQLMQLMNSKIEVESTANQGSEFYFTVKLLRCQPSNQAIVPHQPMLCWIVEDNSVNQQILSAYLKIDNHDTQVFSRGVDCLLQLAHHQPEVILMDLNLEDTTGIELCKEIRTLEAQEQRKACFILGLTGETEVSRLQAWQASGVNLILNKPVQLQQLRKALTDHC